MDRCHSLRRKVLPDLRFRQGAAIDANFVHGAYQVPIFIAILSDVPVRFTAAYIAGHCLLLFDEDAIDIIM